MGGKPERFYLVLANEGMSFPASGTRSEPDLVLELRSPEGLARKYSPIPVVT